MTWFRMKCYPFDKEITTTELADTGPLREATARLEYLKCRDGIMLLTGEPGIGS